MKGLRCTTSNCEYNKNMHCTATNIEINKRGICNTKMKREGGILAQVFENFEAASELDEELSNVTVRCDANCLYNLNGLCGRESISVEDGLVSTKCFSRKKPM